MVYTTTYWQLFIDGASRGNPGLAAAGVVILKNGTPFFKEGFFLGIKTNNQAEYLAFLIGLKIVKDCMQPGDKLAVFSDSQLMVRHILGQYQVRNAGIIPLFQLAKKTLQSVGGTITHVFREENKEADAMANKGVAERIVLSEPLVLWLRAHDITL